MSEMIKQKLSEVVDRVIQEKQDFGMSHTQSILSELDKVITETGFISELTKEAEQATSIYNEKCLVRPNGNLDKQLVELLDDEELASEEYSDIASLFKQVTSEHKQFSEMSGDELRHYKTILKVIELRREQSRECATLKYKMNDAIAKKEAVTKVRDKNLGSLLDDLIEIFKNIDV